MFDYAKSVVELYQKLSPNMELTYLLMDRCCPPNAAATVVQRAHASDVCIDALCPISIEPISPHHTGFGVRGGHVIVLSWGEPSSDVMKVAMTVSMLKKHSSASVQIEPERVIQDLYYPWREAYEHGGYKSSR